jgi:hypothetical protein
VVLHDNPATRCNLGKPCHALEALGERVIARGVYATEIHDRAPGVVAGEDHLNVKRWHLAGVHDDTAIGDSAAIRPFRIPSLNTHVTARELGCVFPRECKLTKCYWAVRIE